MNSLCYILFGGAKLETNRSGLRPPVQIFKQLTSSQPQATGQQYNKTTATKNESIFTSREATKGQTIQVFGCAAAWKHSEQLCCSFPA